MTTRYIVKKCHELGFAQTINDAQSMFDDNEYVELHLTMEGFEAKDEDGDVIEDNDYFKTFYTLEDLEKYVDKLYNKTIKTNPQANGIKQKHRLFVTLGYEESYQTDVPVSNDETTVINEFRTQKLPIDVQEEIREFVLEYYNDFDLLSEKEIGQQLATFLIELFPNLRDGDFRENIIEVLNYNNIQTFDLLDKYPQEYINITKTRSTNAPAFDDIKIAYDKDDVNVSTKHYRVDKDALRKATIGKTAQLNAFTENQFAIVHNKKSSGCVNKVANQNHDILDTLAVNGVILVPNSSKPLSMYKLMKVLEKFSHFDIVFIHSMYENRFMKAEAPCEQIIPAYKLNGGEILAIAYKYVVSFFFAYCSIVSDSMLELRYYI